MMPASDDRVLPAPDLAQRLDASDAAFSRGPAVAGIA